VIINSVTDTVISSSISTSIIINNKQWTSPSISYVRSRQLIEEVSNYLEERNQDKQSQSSTQRLPKNSAKYNTLNQYQSLLSTMIESAIHHIQWSPQATQTTAACNVLYTISIPNTASIGYTSASEAYNLTTSILTSAVSSGQFTTQLQTFAVQQGASTLANVTALNLTISSAQIAILETSSSSSPFQWTAGSISVIVIVGIAVIVMFMGTWYYYVKVKRSLKLGVYISQNKTGRSAEKTHEILLY
jgi:hypothetical protein